jgi:hypothetical protein
MRIPANFVEIVRSIMRHGMIAVVVLALYRLRLTEIKKNILFMLTVMKK